MFSKLVLLLIVTVRWRSSQINPVISDPRFLFFQDQEKCQGCLLKGSTVDSVANCSGGGGGRGNYCPSLTQSPIAKTQCSNSLGFGRSCLPQSESDNPQACPLLGEVSRCEESLPSKWKASCPPGAVDGENFLPSKGHGLLTKMKRDLEK